MNIVLWVLQVALAWFSIAGGAFQIFKFDDLAKGVKAMSPPTKGLWALLGAVGCLGGVAVILPGALHVLPLLTPFAAAVLAAENALISALYLRAGDRAPLPYSVAIAIIAVLVAVGRFVLVPF